MKRQLMFSALVAVATAAHSTDDPQTVSEFGRADQDGYSGEPHGGGAQPKFGVPKVQTEEERQLDSRLQEIEASTYRRVDGSNFRSVALSAQKLGKINPGEWVDEVGKEATSVGFPDLVQLLTGYADLVGDMKSYEFVINRVYTRKGFYYLRFSQVVSGVSLPNSMATVTPDGDVIRLRIVAAKPTEQIFDQSTWLSSGELRSRLEQYLDANEGGKQEEPIVSVGYAVVADPNTDGLAVVHKYEHRHTLYSMNAQTGDLVYSSSLVADAAKLVEKNGKLKL